jgi:hypothetical protein
MTVLQPFTSFSHFHIAIALRCAVLQLVATCHHDDRCILTCSSSQGNTADVATDIAAVCVKAQVSVTVSTLCLAIYSDMYCPFHRAMIMVAPCGSNAAVSHVQQLCDRWGWCGKHSTHCDTTKGCQKAYGSCPSTSPIPKRGGPTLLLRPNYDCT